MVDDDLLGENTIQRVPDEGTYDATLVDIQPKTIMVEVEYEDSVKTEPRDILEWHFDVTDDEGTILVQGTTSTIFSNMSKGGSWASAIIGRELKDKEQVRKSMIVGKNCIVALKHRIVKPQRGGQELHFAYIDSVLPPKKKKGN